MITAVENSTHSDHSYSLISIKAEYQMFDQTEWKKAPFDITFEEGRIPFEVKPRGVEKVLFILFFLFKKNVHFLNI